MVNKVLSVLYVIIKYNTWEQTQWFKNYSPFQIFRMLLVDWNALPYLCRAIFIQYFFLRFVYLLERNFMSKSEIDLPSDCTFPKWFQTLLDLDLKPGSKNFFPGLPCGCNDPSKRAIFHYFRKHCSRELGQECSSLSQTLRTWDCDTTGGGFTCCWALLFPYCCFFCVKVFNNFYKW